VALVRLVDVPVVKSGKNPRPERSITNCDFPVRPGYEPSRVPPVMVRSVTADVLVKPLEKAWTRLTRVRVPESKSVPVPPGPEVISKFRAPDAV
jgi:hypothetical protein